MPQVDQRVYYTLGRDTGLAIMDNKVMNELLVYAKPLNLFRTVTFEEHYNISNVGQ